MNLSSATFLHSSSLANRVHFFRWPGSSRQDSKEDAASPVIMPGFEPPYTRTHTNVRALCNSGHEMFSLGYRRSDTRDDRNNNNPGKKNNAMSRLTSWCSLPSHPVLSLMFLQSSSICVLYRVAAMHGISQRGDLHMFEGRIPSSFWRKWRERGRGIVQGCGVSVGVGVEGNETVTRRGRQVIARQCRTLSCYCCRGAQSCRYQHRRLTPTPLLGAGHRASGICSDIPGPRVKMALLNH